MIDEKVVEEAWLESVEQENNYNDFCDMVVQDLLNGVRKTWFNGSKSKDDMRHDLQNLVENVEYRRKDMIRAMEFWRELKRLAEARK